MRGAIDVDHSLPVGLIDLGQERVQIGYLIWLVFMQASRQGRFSFFWSSATVVSI
jgi:hypothetical protein